MISSRRSRAVSLPRLCCASMRSSPPPCARAGASLFEPFDDLLHGRPAVHYRRKIHSTSPAFEAKLSSGLFPPRESSRGARHVRRRQLQDIPLFGRHARHRRDRGHCACDGTISSGPGRSAGSGRNAEGKKAPPPAGPNVAGTWTGQLVQVGSTAPYNFEIAITARGGDTKYPDLDCVGKLTRVGSSKSYLFFIEVITKGQAERGVAVPTGPSPWGARQ